MLFTYSFGTYAVEPERASFAIQALLHSHYEMGIDLRATVCLGRFDGAVFLARCILSDRRLLGDSLQNRSGH